MTTDNKKDNYFDSGSFAEDIRSPKTILGGAALTSLFSTTVGLVGLTVGIAIDENLPLDDTPRDGQQEALAQYNTMLDALSEDYQALQKQKTQIPDRANVPSAFLTHETAEDAESYKNMQWQLARMNGDFNALLNDFSTATLIDPRLNEDDVRDIFDAFETQIGDYTEIAGTKKPDFGDLNHCRPDNLSTLDSEFSAASKAKECSLNQPITNVNMSIGFLVGALPFLLIFGFLGKEWAYSKKGLNLNAPKFKH